MKKTRHIPMPTPSHLNLGMATSNSISNLKIQAHLPRQNSLETLSVSAASGNGNNMAIKRPATPTTPTTPTRSLRSYNVHKKKKARPDDKDGGGGVENEMESPGVEYHVMTIATLGTFIFFSALLWMGFFLRIGGIQSSLLLMGCSLTCKVAVKRSPLFHDFSPFFLFFLRVRSTRSNEKSTVHTHARTLRQTSMYIIGKACMYVVMIARLDLAFKDSTFSYPPQLIKGLILFIGFFQFLILILTVLFTEGDASSVGEDNIQQCNAITPSFLLGTLSLPFSLSPFFAPYTSVRSTRALDSHGCNLRYPYLLYYDVFIHKTFINIIKRKR